MSLNRYAKKRDAMERPIIDALEERGYDVRQLDRPCDLLTRRPSWPGGLFQALEVKTPQGKKGTARVRPEQEAQQNFCLTTGTPIVKTPVEALTVVQNVDVSMKWPYGGWS
jgi:hypothetical protein